MNVILKKAQLLCAAVAAMTALAGTNMATAQEVDNTAEFVAFIKGLTATRQVDKNIYLPGVMHAVVAPHGTGYVSASLFSPRDGVVGNGPDGSASFGVGFGDAHKTIGGSLTLNATGLMPFADAGDFTLKFSKALSTGENPTYIGIEFNHLAAWGVNAALAKSADISVTHFNSFNRTPYMLTVGYGTQNVSGAGVFGGIGFGLTESLGFGVSAKNGQLTAGFGYKVAQVPGLSLNLDFSNINNKGTPGTNATIVTFGVSFSKADLF